MKDKDKDKAAKAENFEIMPIHDRRRLLAAVAGQVAAGLVSSPSPVLKSADNVAVMAIDIAENILRKVGLH